MLGAPSRQGIAASCSGLVQPLCRNWGIVMVRFLFTGFSSDALQLGFLVLQEMPINVVVTKRLKDNAPFLVFIVSNFAFES